MAASILFVGKANDPLCAQAAAHVQESFPESEVFLGSRSEAQPSAFNEWSGDFIVSYLSPWIIPEACLARAKRAAINFHPGPPEYPGIGCTNFAIYHEETTFGITCHHMLSKVDTGKLIAVRRFPLDAHDSVYTLTQKCYEQISALFYETMENLLVNGPLPELDQQWARQPYTRKELNELCRVTPGMSAAELKRRVRAVSYPGAPGAYVELHGLRFVLDARAQDA